MYIKAIMLQNSKSQAYELGHNIGSFIGENIYLLIALIVGMVAAIVMRKNLKEKP